MAVVAASTTTQNALGFLGRLYQFGERPNSLLKLVGGSGRNELGEEVNVGAGWRRVFQREFPTNVDWDLPAPSQPGRLEGANAPTANTFQPSQAKNVIQIFHEKVSVTYLAESEIGRLTSTGALIAGGSDPHQYFGRFRTQLAAALGKVAQDYNYSAWNGTYSNNANPTAVALGMRGIIPAITTNAIAANGAALSKTFLGDLYQEMIDNAGVQPESLVLYCNTAQLAKINDLYETAYNQGQNRNIGGVMVRQIYTAFGVLNIALDMDIAQDTVVFLNPSVIQGAYLPVEKAGGLQPALFFDPLAKVGSTEDAQVYGQLGIDHGPEWRHGKITGLATGEGS